MVYWKQRKDKSRLENLARFLVSQCKLGILSKNEVKYLYKMEVFKAFGLKFDERVELSRLEGNFKR